jgi:geranylgeranyl reductase family protein
LAAAREGARVVVVERRRVIGAPVQCAEYIPAALLGDLPADRSFLVQPVRAMRTFLPGGEVTEIAAPGFTIRRERFDQVLAAAAAEAGARVLLSTAAAERPGPETVVLKHAAGGRSQIAARVVIGADGPGSVVGRWVGVVHRRRIPGVQARVTLSEPLDATEIYLEPWIHAGYGWLFPKGREANAGVGCIPDPAGCASPRRVLERFLERLRDEGKIGPRVSGYQAGWIPVEPARQSVCGNTLLAGDAAGQTHPITGAGVFSAVTCGQMAGRWAARAVRENNLGLLRHYEEEWRDLLGETLERAGQRRRFMEANWGRFDEIIRHCWVAYREYRAEPAPSAGRGPADQLE